MLLLDAKRLPIALYLPNLIGYVRVISLVVALMEEDPSSSTAIRAVVLSLALDYIDGPIARRLDMCTQFGDLLDHYTDHVTMLWLVWVTTQAAAHTNTCCSASDYQSQHVRLPVAAHKTTSSGP